MFFFFFFGGKGTPELRGAQEPKAQPIPDFGGKPPGYKLLTKDLLDKRDAMEKTAGKSGN
ncbi:MAG: hypothetical protein J4G13_13675 [Dehalococcoidia bacterium]|nr:hypothetical protein [Dehalococcoidia bacterium]